jgi:ABC-2 type transport system permease protein
VTLTPGSIPWLMQHELRLYWRSGVVKATSLTFLIIAQIVLHLAAAVVAFAMRAASAHGGSSLPATLPLLLITGGLAFCFILMVSRALNGIVQVLYTRADLDLLLSSPLAPKSIIGTRVGAVALTVTQEVALLAWPFANVFVLFGVYSWSKLYLLIPAMGMLATSLGVVLALTLFRLLGPRTTRIVGQVLAALIGMGVFLLSQLPNLMHHGPQRGPGNYSGFAALLSSDAWHLGALLIPGRLVLAGYWPTVLFTLINAGLLLVTVRVLSGRFLRAATAIGSMGSARGTRVSARPLRFRGSLRAVLIVKELRLIRRDPLLLMQLLQQSIYLLPLCLVLWRQPLGGAGRAPWLWLAMILMSGTLATALAWITIAAEDAPELLTAAPLTRATVVRAKIEAALLPLAPLWLLPLLVLWRTHLWFAVSLTLCAFGCSVSTALLQVHRPPGRRDGFKTRSKGAPGKGFIEMGVILSWILLCVLVTWLGGRPGERHAAPNDGFVQELRHKTVRSVELARNTAGNNVEPSVESCAAAG